MATYTLTGASNWSGIKASVANDDEVALAGYALTIDEQPTQTGISVTTAGTAGTVIISGAWNLSTWSFTAGTVALIATAPEGCEIGAVTGGSVNAAYGCRYNYGTITAATGGSASNAHGCYQNYLTITTATGGSASTAYGCGNNYGTITTATGGSVNGAHGCAYNYDTITTATGGSVSTAYGCANNYGTITTATGGSVSSAYGCNANYGTITTATGGSASNAHGCYYNYGTITAATGGSASSAYGCNINYGQVFGATDDVSVSVYLTRGSVKFVDGPAFKSKITTEANFDPLQTLYVLNGTLSAEAVIPEGVEVINLFALLTEPPVGSRPRIYVGGRLRT